MTIVRQVGPHFAALENLEALATSGTLGILALLMRAPPARGEHSYIHRPGSVVYCGGAETPRLAPLG